MLAATRQTRLKMFLQKVEWWGGGGSIRYLEMESLDQLHLELALPLDLPVT